MAAIFGATLSVPHTEDMDMLSDLSDHGDNIEVDQLGHGNIGDQEMELADVDLQHGTLHIKDDEIMIDEEEADMDEEASKLLAFVEADMVDDEPALLDDEAMVGHNETWDAFSETEDLAHEQADFQFSAAETATIDATTSHELGQAAPPVQEHVSHVEQPVSEHATETVISEIDVSDPIPEQAVGALENEPLHLESSDQHVTANTLTDATFGEEATKEDEEHVADHTEHPTVDPSTQEQPWDDDPNEEPSQHDDLVLRDDVQGLDGDEEQQEPEDDQSKPDTITEEQHGHEDLYDEIHYHHSVLVEYQKSQISLFPEEGSLEYLLTDHSLVEKSFGELFKACRQVLGDNIRDEHALQLVAGDLGLSISEVSLNTQFLRS
jgi:hypothetical protein